VEHYGCSSGSALHSQQDDTAMASDKQAVLYRMVLPDHTCPFGVRARQMLTEHGYEVDDRVLSTREETDAFQQEQGVNTTPQVFIDGERIGGSDELARYLENA
jgi:glutaredoxin 3